MNYEELNEKYKRLVAERNKVEKEYVQAKALYDAAVFNLESTYGVKTLEEAQDLLLRLHTQREELEERIASRLSQIETIFKEAGVVV